MLIISGTDKHFDKKDFIDTMTSWQFWYFSIQYFFLTVRRLRHSSHLLVSSLPIDIVPSFLLGSMSSFLLEPIASLILDIFFPLLVSISYLALGIVSSLSVDIV